MDGLCYFKPVGGLRPSVSNIKLKLIPAATAVDVFANAFFTLK